MTNETPKEPQTEDKGAQDVYQVGKVCPYCNAVIAADERLWPPHLRPALPVRLAV